MNSENKSSEKHCDAVAFTYCATWKAFFDWDADHNGRQQAQPAYKCVLNDGYL